MSNDEIDDRIRDLLASDDPAALDMIWTTYASSLLGYLISILCSRHDAEDVLQDVFVTVARKREEVAKARQFKAYLFMLGRNAALNRIKMNRRRLARETKASEWLACEGEPSEAPSEAGRVQAALEALHEEQRSVIVLKFFRDKTFREIGELMGVSENTAGSRYRYGMARLKKIIGGSGNEQ